MSGKKFFNINAGNQPNSGIAITVVGERGRKELPPGTKGGENLKPDRHYEHKQHAFDSYCKRSIKNEAMNAYTQLRKRSRREVSLSELPEAAMAQLAVYDCYSWEYTTFPVGGAVILIENDRLAEALLALPQEDRDIFMMHWFLNMVDREIAEYMNMARRTVNTRRQKAYRLLKELMGGEADDLICEYAGVTAPLSGARCRCRRQSRSGKPGDPALFWLYCCAVHEDKL